MLSLYNLYDLYRSVKKTEKLTNRPDLCSDLRTLILYYNQFDENYYKDDSILRNLLEKLRDTIQKNTWLSEVNCKVNLSDLQPLKNVPTRKVQETFLLTDSHQASTSTKRESENVENIYQGVSEIQGQEENLLKKVETLGGSKRELEEKGDGKDLGGNSQVFPKTLDSLYPKQTIQEFERSLSSGNISDTMHSPTKHNNSSGILNQIQYSLSDTLQNIDPVPVVGVSGGIKNMKIYPCFNIKFKLPLLPNYILKFLKFSYKY
ncbi:hypothetical protein PCYB_005610 [Plasmodium cynomolgi strain B]|uniref:CYIR protein n=1 Tax=Plasmodium cynomolgi (strain B) TaxID=1120755 RepID=K6VK44_PLACD|nr:hypothetical protein PCYB_005610 [Plasmodium cynomolgi strain B]GAB69812.1 hypothetical protein PCYB_005610 [Plasmodium cynomolgi strain B]